MKPECLIATSTSRRTCHASIRIPSRTRHAQPEQRKPTSNGSRVSKMDVHDPITLAQALIRCPSVTPKEAGALLLIENLLEPLGFDVHRMTFSEAGYAGRSKTSMHAFGKQRPNLCFRRPYRRRAGRQGGRLETPALRREDPGRRSLWPRRRRHERIDRVFHCGDRTHAQASAAAFAVRSRCSLPETRKGHRSMARSKSCSGWSDRDERLDACIVGEPTCPDELGDMIKIGRRGSITGSAGRAWQAGPRRLPASGRQSRYPSWSTFSESCRTRRSMRAANGSSRPICRRRSYRCRIRPPTSFRRRRARPSTCATTIIGRARRSRRGSGSCAPRPRTMPAPRIGLTFHGTGDVFFTQPGQLVDAMTTAVRGVTGKVPKLSTSGGTSDARFIQAHCPVIEFGLVNRTIHQIDEHCAIDDLRTADDDL